MFTRLWMAIAIAAAAIWFGLASFAADGRTTYWTLSFVPPVLIHCGQTRDSSVEQKACLALAFSGEKVQGTIRWGWGPGPDDGGVEEIREVEGDVHGKAVQLRVKHTQRPPADVVSSWKGEFGRIQHSLTLPWVDPHGWHMSSKAEFQRACQQFSSLSDKARELDKTLHSNNIQFDMVLEGNFIGTRMEGVVRENFYTKDGKNIAAPVGEKFIISPSSLTGAQAAAARPPISTCMSEETYPRVARQPSWGELNSLTARMMAACLYNAASCAAYAGDISKAQQLNSKAFTSLTPYSDSDIDVKHLRKRIVKDAPVLKTMAANLTPKLGEGPGWLSADGFCEGSHFR